jgi:hypothetical protein
VVLSLWLEGLDPECLCEVLSEFLKKVIEIELGREILSRTQENELTHFVDFGEFLDHARVHVTIAALAELRQNRTVSIVHASFFCSPPTSNSQVFKN